MTNPLFLATLAFFLTYLLHSTVLLGGLWLVLRTRLVRSMATENGLWKAALLGGLVTAGLQSGLGLEPWSGFLPMQPSAEVVARGAAPTLPAEHRPTASAPTPRPQGIPALRNRALRGLAQERPFRATEEMPASGLPVGSWGAFLGARSSVLVANQIAREVDARQRATERTQIRAGLASTRPIDSLQPAGASSRPTRPVRSVVDPSGASITWTVAFGLWFTLAAIGIARFLGLRTRLRRVLDQRQPVSDPGALAILERLRQGSGLRGPIALSTSCALAGPIAVGRSEVCLPPRAITDLDPQRLEAMLAHEVAHLVRRDPLWLNLCAVLEAVLFFQPLNRLAGKRIQATAEFLCDDWAAAKTGRGIVLARCLAQVAAWIEESARPLPAAGMARPDSTLIQRVRRLAEGSPAPAVSRPVRATLVGAVVLGAVSCSVPGISAEGRAGFLARLVAAWHSAHDVAPLEAQDGSADEVVLVVADGEVIGVRVGEREIDLVGALSEVGPQDSDEEGRSLIVLPTGSDRPVVFDRLVAPTSYPDEPEDEEFCEDHVEPNEPEEWDEAEEWDELEPWIEDDGEPRWDSRSLSELTERMRAIEEQYTRQHVQLTTRHDRHLQQFQQEYQQSLQRTERDLEVWVTRWNERYHTAQTRRQTEWQSLSNQANEELARLQQQLGSDPDGYRERLAEWRDDYEETLSDHEERWAEWEEETRDAYEDAMAEFEDERSEQQERWIDGQEELIDARLEAFDELEGWFEESYWEVRDAFLESLDERGGNPCEHSCKRRCRNGCTHPEEPEEPELRTEPDEAPEAEQPGLEREPETPGVVWNERRVGSRQDG